MQGFEYYFDIDEKYHSEVYELLQLLEIDVDDGNVLEQQLQARDRLEELKKISKK